ncbi:general secretion pathway protein GspK [Chromatocurvus halotolerans]|uniref:general secretion pathway protein GspK n=1 Tax=Chromatocurvus halotolerans TaxID=1132028 RepID=UPI000E3BF2A7|nr:general secretion pathway protein GspK [Chromatocurvus halotolerans]
MRQRGVALAIVVWFIAGMSLLVAGIVSQARVDIQLAQLHLFRAQAEAAGDGAIHLLMAQLQESPGADGGAMEGLPFGRYRFGEAEVRVMALPAQALVDVNSAPQALLAQLWSEAAGLPRDEAVQLAVNMVEWRSNRGGGNRGGGRFDVVEDVLRVEGMTRTRLDAVRHFISAGQGGGMANAAPQERLRQLSALAPGSGWNSGSLETSALPGARTPQAARSATRFRVDAIVDVGGRQWLRRRWVASQSAMDSRLPWRTERTEIARVVGNAP